MPSIPQIIFLAICLAISGYAGTLLVNALRSRSWPSVEGTITTSRIVMALFSGSGASQFRPTLELEYSYTVNGHPYTGKRIAGGPNSWFSMGSPARLHERYPQGSHVTVFYNPTNPRLATLVRGVPGYFWSFYAIAGLFALLGALSIVNLF